MVFADQIAAANMFDEDLDDDDVESSDRDSASSARVTIAVPAMPLRQQHPIPPENIVAKRPAILDESRKLFQRLWTDEDEIELLQGFLDYTTRSNGSSQHHDTTAFYDQIRSRFQLDFNKNQLVEKLRRLKKKYRNVITRSGNGKEFAFRSPHEQASFEISSKIWGNSVAANNGSSSALAIRAVPAPMEEEEDDVNNPNFSNFFDYQSADLNGIDINSKTPPLSRKRMRIAPVKLEEKHQHIPNINVNVNTTPPSLAPPSIPNPAMNTMISGALSAVVEETVKSCLAPILKEFLSNSMNSTPNQNGVIGGNGFSLGRGPIPFGLGSNYVVSNPSPFCFSSTLGGDKASNERWRKQQILELEVFSKRVELMQVQIREQLQDLRPIGN